MKFVLWDKLYKLNIAPIDQEHKQIVDMLNELHDSLETEGNKTLVEDVLQRMSVYAQTHFRNEEAYMKKIFFPEYDAHVKSHQVFIDKLQSFKADLEAERAFLLVELVHFLRDWLVQHIGDLDRKIAEYVKNSDTDSK